MPLCNVFVTVSTFFIWWFITYAKKIEGSVTILKSLEREEPDLFSALHGKGIDMTPMIVGLNYTTETFYKRLRFKSLSRPSCVSWGNWRVHCFYRGKKNAIYHLEISDRGVSHPVSRGGHAFNNVQCVSTAVGKIGCVIIGPLNLVHTKSYSNGTWSKWIDQRQRFNEVGRSSCVATTNTTYRCVLLHSKDYGMEMSVSENSEFADFECLNRALTYRSSFSCLASRGHEVHCIAANHMNLLMDRHWTSWRYWNYGIGVGPQVGDHPEPSSVRLSDQSFMVFGVSRTNEMVATQWIEEIGYLTPVVVGGIMISYSPECVLVKNESIYCLAVGTDSFLHATYYNGFHWSAWETIAEDVYEPVSCALADDQDIYCLGRTVGKNSLFSTVLSIK